MNHCEDLPNKQMHCYLISYKLGSAIGHMHIYCDAPFTPPRDTIDVLESIAGDKGGNPGDVIITSIFYFGFIFPKNKGEEDQKEEPQDKPWQIWREGYETTGVGGEAFYMTTIEAKTFNEAVEKLFREADEDTRMRLDPKECTYWGCRLFDNEVDARKSFG